MAIIVWLEENLNKKGKDGMEGRKKINQQFTGRKAAKHVAGPTNVFITRIQTTYVIFSCHMRHMTFHLSYILPTKEALDKIVRPKLALQLNFTLQTHICLFFISQ